MLNIADLFNSKVSLFQHDPQASSCICSILTWVKEVHRGRNWLLEFSNSYEQPSSFPRHCKGDDVRVLLGFPKSVLHSCCIHTHSWHAWLTSSLIIVDVRSTIFQLSAQFSGHSALLLCHHLTVPWPYCAITLLCHHLTVPSPYCAITLMCHHLTVPSLYTSANWWWFLMQKPCFPIKTKYHYELLLRTKFPGSFPVPVIVSHEQHLMCHLLHVTSTTNASFYQKTECIKTKITG